MQAITVADLMSRLENFGSVMILQIDTEGYDFNIIKSAFEANLTPPSIQYEHKHLSLGDQCQCRELLEGVGYSFLTSTVDMICFNDVNL